MSGLQFAALVLLILIVVPMPLVWLIGIVFPNGYTKGHSQRIGDYFKKEWKRILLCGVVVGLMFVFARDYALQVTLLGAAVLVGRFLAVSRNK